MLDGFNELVKYSRSPTDSEVAALRIAGHAAQILAQFPKYELHMARLYYNTQQLLGYWRYYRNLVEAAISKGQVSRNFPLLLATSDPINRRVNLEGINIHQMRDGLFIKTDCNPHPPSFKRQELKYEQALLDDTLCAQGILDSLYGRLTLVSQYFYNTSVILYQMFLASERQAASEIWDSYKIHIFLDNFMYRFSDGSSRSSRFDFVFFANNRLELLVWLNASLKSGEPRSIKQVETFLNNQTKHYLRLSQSITLEKNEVLNCHKELLSYDGIQELVLLGSVPAEILDECRAPIQKMGVASLGCPFARARGVKINALTELYQYSDQLFLSVLEDSWEFKRLFQQKSI